MPVKSSNSYILKWPDKKAVEQELKKWVDVCIIRDSRIIAIGFFGSYATGNWGVGSDLDLIIITENASEPLIYRSTMWDTSALPVPVDLLIYTSKEFGCEVR